LFAAGIGVVLFLALLGFLPVGTDAGSISLDNPVGSDLTVAQKSLTTPGSGSSASTRNKAYPSMTRYQMSSLTPRRDPKLMLNRSKNRLEFITHTVQKGENIWKIARRYGLKTHSIVSTNYESLSNRDYLPAGMELRVPNRNGIMTELKRNQTLWDLMKTYGTDHEDVLEFNGLESASQIGAGEKIFVPGALPVNPYKFQLFQEGGSEEFSWPVSPGRRHVSSEFGHRDHPILDRVIPHRGIDIAAKYGTAIFASRAGIVREAGTNGGYGYMVKIRHADNYRTVYAHLRNGFVREGQYVQKGQRIGEIGQSGLATGPNLHFEVQRGDQALNPLKFLP
jgi:murein DD-endopeptidase MepM/ murein hydrolase activator NlpD